MTTPTQSVCAQSARPRRRKAALLATALALAAAVLPSSSSAGIDFVVTFEPDSKWFTETWSAEARTEMQAFLAELGARFDCEATVRVTITDDATNAYASAGSNWYDWVFHAPTGGYVQAPSLWMIVVQGIHRPTATSDVTINWNLDAAQLYEGSAAALIRNIRGLGRHEMHHAFGCVSSLYLNSTYDPRGLPTYAALMDPLYHDLNGTPLLGMFDAATYQFATNPFALAPDWATGANQSGLYVEARDLQGRMVPMPPISGEGTIDFSHVKGIAYVNDHPTWYTYESTDLNFLRALGYPLLVDSALRQRPAAVTHYRFSENQAELTCLSSPGFYYRLATSTDLRHWQVLPVGVAGTGAPLLFTYPLNTATEPLRFFQVVEVPE